MTNSKNAPRAPASSKENRRISLNVPGDIAQLIDYLADSQNISVTEVLKRSVISEAYLYKERQSGSKILVQKANQDVVEIVFR